MVGRASVVGYQSTWRHISECPDNRYGRPATGGNRGGRIQRVEHQVESLGVGEQRGVVGTVLRARVLEIVRGRAGVVPGREAHRRRDQTVQR